MCVFHINTSKGDILYNKITKNFLIWFLDLTLPICRYINFLSLQNWCQFKDLLIIFIFKIPVSTLIIDLQEIWAQTLQKIVS